MRARVPSLSVTHTTASQANLEGALSLQYWGSFDNLYPHSCTGQTGLPRTAVSQLLLERYRAQGETFVDGLTGDFSLIVRDPRNDLTILACDGMGNGYLSYGWSEGQLVAGPDDSAVVASMGQPSPISEKRLAEFFTLAEVSGPDTFFKNVKALLPGEMLIFQARTVRRRWLRRPRLDLRIERASWEDYVEEFAELLGASVRRGLCGFDRVAVLMSGGLDSTPIAALASRCLSGGGSDSPVTALSWKLWDSRGDESSLVRATAERAGIDIEWIDCDDAVPFFDLANWPVHPSTPQQTAFRWFHHRSLVRAAELGHRLVLSGFCGDALYAHARRWTWDLLAAEGPGRVIDRLREVAAGVGWRRTLRTHLFGPLLPRAHGPKRRRLGFVTDRARQLLTSLPCWPPDLDTARRPQQAERALALLDARGENFERHYAEQFGLELRLPLRDFALVQYMLAVPDHLLLQGVETRPVLRSAVRGLVPEEVRLRKGKAAFVDVFDRGMATANLSWTKNLLLDPDALWRGFIEEAAIRSWVEATPSDRWEVMGYLHAIYGELWRRKRAGLPWPSADAVD